MRNLSECLSAHKSCRKLFGSVSPLKMQYYNFTEGENFGTEHPLLTVSFDPDKQPIIYTMSSY